MNPNNTQFVVEPRSSRTALVSSAVSCARWHTHHRCNAPSPHRHERGDGAEGGEEGQESTAPPVLGEVPECDDINMAARNASLGPFRNSKRKVFRQNGGYTAEVNVHFVSKLAAIARTMEVPVVIEYACSEQGPGFAWASWAMHLQCLAVLSALSTRVRQGKGLHVREARHLIHPSHGQVASWFFRFQTHPLPEVTSSPPPSLKQPTAKSQISLDTSRRHSARCAGAWRHLQPTGLCFGRVIPSSGVGRIGGSPRTPRRHTFLEPLRPPYSHSSHHQATMRMRLQAKCFPGVTQMMTIRQGSDSVLTLCTLYPSMPIHTTRIPSSAGAERSVLLSNFGLDGQRA